MSNFIRISLSWLTGAFYVLAMLALCAALTGCVGMPETKGEWAFHAVNALDTMQTINHGKDPCYIETAPVTAAVLGDHPKAGETVLFMAGVSVLHRLVSWELQRNNVPPTVQRIWEAVSITPKAYTVVQNHREGIRPWGNNVGDCQL